jgi:hypothetical protein
VLVRRASSLWYLPTKEESKRVPNFPRSLAPKIVVNEAGSLVSILPALMTISPGGRPDCSLKSTAALKRATRSQDLPSLLR